MLEYLTFDVDLVKSLLKTVEEQKEQHANQLGTLTKTLTHQMETLKTEVTNMTEKVQTQLSNIQTPPSASPSYVDVARTPPTSQPSNLRTLSTINTTSSAMTNTIYCTIDRSRVREEDTPKAQPGPIREAIEKESV